MPRSFRCLFVLLAVSAAPAALGQDLDPPSVSFTLPTDGTVGVATSVATVFVHFDEQMDRDSYADNVYVTVGADPGGVRVAVATMHTGGTYCGLEPAETLAPETVYGLHATAGVTDLAGNPLSGPYTGTFTTETAAGEDTDPPFVILTVPLAGAIDVPADLTAVDVEFNEHMDAASLVGAVRMRVGLTADGPPVALTDLTVEGGTCTLTPVAPLAAGTIHSLHVTSAAADLAGNLLAGDFSCSFRTAAAGPDASAPFVTSTDPSDGAAGIRQDISSVRIDFNELMTIESYEGNITVSGPGAGVAHLVVGVSHVTLVLQGALATSTEYVVEVGAGVMDVAGNPLAAPHTVRFTTSDQVPGERTSWGGLKASYR